jgi:hypothetical protein
MKNPPVFEWIFRKSLLEKVISKGCQINLLFNELCEMLKEAGITLDGLFLNADSGFDSKELKKFVQRNVFPFRSSSLTTVLA